MLVLVHDQVILVTVYYRGVQRSIIAALQDIKHAEKYPSNMLKNIQDGTPMLLSSIQHKHSVYMLEENSGIWFVFQPNRKYSFFL